MNMDIRRPPKPKRSRLIVAATLLAATVVALIVGLTQLEAAAPTVDRSSLWIDRVRRGPMRREVQGLGTFVALDVRWITASAPASVERVRVLPGTRVEEDTILLDLVNPDVELLALEADRQLAQARAELTNLEASLTNQRLAQESVVASLGSEREEAQRRAAADEELAKRGFLSELEMASSRDRATTLSGRRTFEEKRLAAFARGSKAQVQAQREQVERLRSIAEFRKKQLDALHVRAGVAGVLQEMQLQPGQSVTAGAPLAKIAQPDRLKAELRVPETQAKDIELGQNAVIDTRNGTIKGKVMRIDPAAVSGTVRVDIELEGALPPGSRPDLSVEGVIELEHLENVLHIGRAAFAQADATIRMFKLDGENEAVRANVQLGKMSARTIEIRGGLAEGDRVILSDMSDWEGVERLRLR